MQEGPSEGVYGNGQVSVRVTYKNGEFHGPCERYHEDGELQEKGTYNMGEKCGEWLETTGGGPPIRTVTYDPCPPGLEDGN